MMMDGGPMGVGMMIGMAIAWLLIITLLLLSIAALVKYLRSGSNRRTHDDQ